MILHGIVVAIVGPQNLGTSTFFCPFQCCYRTENNWYNTRCNTNLNGYKYILHDTGGVRSSQEINDIVEKQDVECAIRVAINVDFIIVMIADMKHSGTQVATGFRENQQQKQR